MRDDDPTTVLAQQSGAKAVGGRQVVLHYVLRRLLHRSFAATLGCLRTWGLKTEARIAAAAWAHYRKRGKVLGPPAASRFTRSTISPKKTALLSRKAFTSCFLGATSRPCHDAWNVVGPKVEKLCAQKFKSHRRLVKLLEGIHGFGHFRAGDLSNDILEHRCLHKMAPSQAFHDTNKWSYIGPGASAGLNIIYRGHPLQAGPDDMVELLRLTQTAPVYLGPCLHRLGSKGVRPAPRHVEFILCDYQRWARDSKSS